MKRFNHILGLGFTGDELPQKSWESLDGISSKRKLVANLADASASQLQMTDCLLVKLGAKVSASTMDLMPNLKHIAMLGTGCGGIDTKTAAQRGITVTNIADYATEAVSEFSFGILLEQMRRIAQAKQQAQKGDYSDTFNGGEIRGKTFGVIGLGNIGLRTAELAQAFGADVIYWSKHRKKSAESKGIMYTDINTLLANSDIISINLSLNSDTEKLLNSSRLASVKPGAVMINLSPMELLDFKALVKRIGKNDLTFMLDHSDEMTNEQLKTLRQFDNCTIYPPIAYLTSEASLAKQRIFVNNLKNYLVGKPTNQVH